jgi:transcriptional regulator with XRE-family HTH domain
MYKPLKAKRKLETFGEILRRKRIEKKLDTDQLAKRSSVNAATIKKIEQGGNTTMITLDKIADAMSVDLGEIFGELEKYHKEQYL